MSAPAVHYRLSLARPGSHLAEVEARLPAGADGRVDAVLPVWTPGSYLVREFARHVQEVRAETPEGAPLPLTRVDKRTWRVEARGAPWVVLRYRVWAHELTVRTSHLDTSHGSLHGATLFLYTEASRHLPHRVRVEAPDGWHTACALPEGEDGALEAPDYDALVDSPLEVGPHARPVAFDVAGVPHALVTWGGDVPDASRLTQDLARVCEEAARLWGAPPSPRYLFLLLLTDKGRGGLEHRDSSVLLFPRAQLGSARGWEDLLTLAAHEYFHRWNVKRLLPRAFVPFDYAQESYTRQLWAFEGMTSYYDNVLVRRAGLLSAQRYLTRLGETLSQLHATPGRRVQTLEEASLLAWVKQYRPDEHSADSAVSYYLKGEVVAALLDLEVRRATGDRRSLDDVCRLAWARWGDGRGVPEGGWEEVASEVAGVDLGPFFARALRSTDELDYAPFEHVGLTLRLRVRESPGDKGGSPPRPREARPRGWLGLTTRGSQTVASVQDGSPAQEAGVAPDDELVALDGWKVDAAGLAARCEDRRPGECVRLTVFRRERLIELAVVLGEKPRDAAWLARVDQPTAAQRAAYERWLGVSWDEGAG